MANAAIAEDRPRRILQITGDKLRGDLLQRQSDQFGPCGFRQLMEQGVQYDNAHHACAKTETMVGHSTLTTGAHPAAHGMSGPAGIPSTVSRTQIIRS
ncbi:alkaline phosphatase family protein [Tropicimonas sp. S265A]|uniref:alkaline phosphatase family protein n=1 Tax=Tropicimonas sp. S265A TaxID=3415134 RepID=UPI003C7E6174